MIRKDTNDIGNIWRHKDGGYYVIIGVENQRADEKIVIWYQGIKEDMSTTVDDYCRERDHFWRTFVFVANSYEEWREMATSAVDEPDAACERVERTAIDETLAQRGSVYGSFEAQATCVGAIINDCIACAAQNGKPMVEDKALGCIAYIAVKLARFAVEPVGDTSHDLHGYAKLIDELFNGEVKNGR